LFGLRKGGADIRLNGADQQWRDARAGMRAGAVYLTEDRKSKGPLLEETIATNLMLAAVNKFQRGPLVDQAKESRALDEAIQRFDIRVGDQNLLGAQKSPAEAGSSPVRPPRSLPGQTQRSLSALLQGTTYVPPWRNCDREQSPRAAPSFSGGYEPSPVLNSQSGGRPEHQRFTLRTCRRLQLRQGADFDPDAGGLGRRLDHFAGRRIADESACASRRDLAQTNLQKARQDEFTDATRMDGAEEQVLQRRIHAGGGLPRDFVLFREEIDQRRFGQGLLDRLDRRGSSLRSLPDRSIPSNLRHQNLPIIVSLERVLAPAIRASLWDAGAIRNELQPIPSLRLMKNDTDRMTLSGPHAADDLSSVSSQWISASGSSAWSKVASIGTEATTF
jgi:hypothetical protein